MGHWTWALVNIVMKTLHCVSSHVQ